jgi:predicted ATPase
LLQLVIDGIRSDFPPLRSLSARFELIPADISSFVGRGAEIDEIGRLLATTRLLTLIGPGGSGKTRLALEIARRSRGAYADGVAYVPLSSITDPRLVGSAVRHTLGFSEEVGRGSVETLIERIGGLDLLIVLDNFEHVLDASRDIGALLAGTLEGLPLAIELAASRIRLLPLDAILARLERRLDLLRGPSPDRDARQRTLRGAIDWSHDLLGRPERIVFRRLGAFIGGATLGAGAGHATSSRACHSSAARSTIVST